MVFLQPGKHFWQINGREVQPSFDRLWHDYLEDEGRIHSRFGPTTEKDHALAAKTKKGKRFPSTQGQWKGTLR